MSEGQGGEAGKCAAKVIRQTGRTKDTWDFMPCRRPAKFLAEGKEWCWQHKPSSAAEIVHGREMPTPNQPIYLNSKQVAKRYGHSASWPRHCGDLRKIARKVGKFLMWRVDELEALETYQLKEDRERTEAADKEKFEAKLLFTLRNRDK